MKKFFRGGRELPQGQRYARLILQNKIISKTNLISSEYKESLEEKLTFDEKNSYATYLASKIYDYQLKLKYVSIGLITFFLTILGFDFANAEESIQSEIVPLKFVNTIPESIWDYTIIYIVSRGIETKFAYYTLTS